MEIKLNISEKEITSMLMDAFNKHPQALLLSSTIINNLINTPTGIEHLLKALIGLSVTTKYKIGDTVIELEYDLWDDGAEFCKRDEFNTLESSIVLYDDDIELI